MPLSHRSRAAVFLGVACAALMCVVFIATDSTALTSSTPSAAQTLLLSRSDADGDEGGHLARGRAQVAEKNRQYTAFKRQKRILEHQLEQDKNNLAKFMRKGGLSPKTIRRMQRRHKRARKAIRDSIRERQMIERSRDKKAVAALRHSNRRSARRVIDTAKAQEQQDNLEYRRTLARLNKVLDASHRRVVKSIQQKARKDASNESKLRKQMRNDRRKAANAVLGKRSTSHAARSSPKAKLHTAPKGRDWAGFVNNALFAKSGQADAQAHGESAEAAVLQQRIEGDNKRIRELSSEHALRTEAEERILMSQDEAAQHAAV